MNVDTTARLVSLLAAAALLALAHANPMQKRDFNDLHGMSKMSKCELHRELVLEAPFVLMEDIWLPNCSPFNRNYMPHQCSNDGWCFCVSRKGRIIEETVVKGTPRCKDHPEALQ
ncbi:PREDICTED: uncharacterized protein LOC106810150 [Priapulus caudatus]|uniref:Uncharacterized protein LOC106810150 n=1 Tax=Priapulus caudatus TaxID=37621 RepID=A0ABM1E9P7_PRICU|nr:PREDICTED: uncharacterized protein LOC106810150 [Priapulus caudatus]